MLHSDLTEKVYENALVIELNKFDLQVLQQQKIVVNYDNYKIGEYFADLVIN